MPRCSNGAKRGSWPDVCQHGPLFLEEQLETYSSVNPECLNHVSDNKVVKPAFGSGSDC
jgi:hypothetical protein